MNFMVLTIYIAIIVFKAGKDLKINQSILFKKKNLFLLNLRLNSKPTLNFATTFLTSTTKDIFNDWMSWAKSNFLGLTQIIKSLF